MKKKTVASLKVASRILCKRLQRVIGPVLVHSVKDTVKDPLAAVAGDRSAHCADEQAACMAYQATLSRTPEIAEYSC